MRKVLFAFGMVVFVLMVSALAFNATAGDDIVIDDCAKKQAAVNFPHEAHKAVTECATCHHTQPDLAAGGEAESCAGCHVGPEDAATPDCAQMSMSKNPYHITCVSCHKTEEKGPTKCTECHPKE
jgi:cytochrome c553